MSKRRDPYLVPSSELYHYICPYCENIIQDPGELSCRHTFCTPCLRKMMLKGYETQRTACAVCGTMVNTTQASTAKLMRRVFYMCHTECPGCSERVSMEKIRQHLFKCKPYLEKKAEEKAAAAAAAAEAAAAAAALLPRPKKPSKRRTKYACPYCHLGGLDIQDMVEHCNALHGHRRYDYLACPICVSMPWGHPHYRTMHFMKHLNLRHRFDYSYYKQMTLGDDDDLVEQTLKLSLEEYQRDYIQPDNVEKLP